MAKKSTPDWDSMDGMMAKFAAFQKMSDSERTERARAVVDAAANANLSDEEYQFMMADAGYFQNEDGEFV